MSKKIADVQSRPSERKVDIDKVGVKDIRYPITVLDKSKGEQHTVARVNMYVNLPHKFKGTHMSRFVEILNEYRGEVSVRMYTRIMEEMKTRLDARSAHLIVEFPYFIEKKAPVTGSPGLMEYRCKITGTLEENSDIVVEVSVPVTTLCPCSREISDHGAHNQRGEVKVNYRFSNFTWFEDVIEIVEECASAQVYSILKREDEKYLTEHAYENPMFVEDVVRAVADRMMEHPDVTWFSVESENFESIHNHSAYAYIERIKQQ